MASIAKLVISLGARIAGFETDMNRASRNQKRRMKQMEREAEAAGRALAVAMTAAAGAMTAVVLRTTETADGMAKMAKRLGTSTEALSELSHVADLSGVQFNQLTIGMQRMERRIAEVAQLGKGEAKQALDQLGLSAKELASLPVDQQFERVAEELSKVQSQSEKVRLAFKLFDSEGVALVQTMGEGAEGIRKMREEANQLGLTISGEFASRSEAFNDNLSRMKALATGAARTFTNSLLPALLDIQTGFLEMDRSASTVSRSGEALGKVLKTLATAFVIVKESALLFGRVLLGTVVAVFNAFRAVAAPSLQLIRALGEAFQKLATGDFSGALDAIKDVPRRIAVEFEAAVVEIQKAGGFLAEQFTDEIPAALERVNKFFNATNKEANKLADGIEHVGDEAKKTAGELEKAEKAANDLADSAFDQLLDMVNELDRDQKEYNERLQEFKDLLDPVARLVRDFEEAQRFLNDALSAHNITAEEYQRILNVLSDRLGKVAAETRETQKETDIWTEEMLEGVRILERSFTSAWESIINGSQNAFDGILDGFKTMLANMLHQLTTAPLIKELEKLLSGGSFDLGALFKAGAGIAGVGLGALLGGGGVGAGIGSGIGGLLGNVAGKKLLEGVFGSFAGPVGSIVGGLIGGVIGGLFDDDPDFELQIVGANLIGDPKLGGRTGPFTNTALGGFFTTHTGDVDPADVDKFVQAIADFDNAFAAFLDGNQLEEVTNLLKDFGLELEGDALTLEGFIGARLQQIQFALDQSVLGFVNAASDLQDEINRTGVAFLTETLFSQRPELFSGRTQSEFLAVVEAFQDGTETIVDAFNEVLALLDIVVGVTDSLKGFAGSDLLADFNALLALQNETPLQSLTRITNELSDAIFNFSGSPEDLVQIGNLVQQVRQGEIQLLTQIDQIQKGLNKSLDRLRQDVTGIIEGPKTADEILAEAASLIDAVSSATSVEDIADISAQFEALIRSLSNDDIAASGDAILSLIDAFQSAANAALDAARAAAVESAESVRELVGAFLEEVGDPLAIIAATNERAAAALESIAGGTVSTDSFTEIPNWPFEQAEIISVAITDTLTEGLGDQRDVLKEGADNISKNMALAMQDVGEVVAQSIRTGFNGAQVNVTVIVDESSLNTE